MHEAQAQKRFFAAFFFVVPHRYDVVSVGQLDKVQLIDAMWDNKEKRREEPFLSLRLMHGEEAHLLLALDDEERASLLKFASAVTAARNPEG